MEWELLAIGTAVGVVVVVVLFRLLGFMERQYADRLETERMKQAWYRQMSSKNPKTSKKSRKSQDEDEEDDDDEPDDLDRLLDALAPYQPLVKGFVQGKGLPVDVDKLFAGDEKERMKVGTFIESKLEQMNKQGALPAGGEKDWWSEQ